MSSTINFALTSLPKVYWLHVYDHPTGPGTHDFDYQINMKSYNKLTMLCTKGTVITYLRKAAEFDSWGAGQQLKLRYHGFSKQRGRTLRTTVENLRHVHGTNITTHIDLFEKLKPSRTKGKGKDKKSRKGPTTKDPCSYCNKPGHEARECRKRMYDEKQKAPHTNNSTDIILYKSMRPR
jgi:hypothetical protein